MTKTLALRIINPLLALSVTTQAITGLLMDLHSEILTETHEANAYVLISLAVVHLTLNWSWVKNNLFRWKRGT